MSEKIKGFVCMTDLAWDFEAHPISMFPTLEKIIRDMPCVNECGVYEIEITIKGRAVEPKPFLDRG